jgi:hypothetical protein
LSNKNIPVLEFREKDICYICQCKPEEHREYTFESKREEIAFNIMDTLFNQYDISGIDNILDCDAETMESSVNDTVKLDLDRANFTYGEISLLTFPLLLRNAHPKVNYYNILFI